MDEQETGHEMEDNTTDEQNAVQAEEALVEAIKTRIRKSRKKASKPFKRMKADMDLVRWGAAMPDEEVEEKDDLDDFPYDDEQYVANIVHRHIQQRTASLYAKNPKATARLRERKVFTLWDEDPRSIAQAEQTLMGAMQTQMAAAAGDPMASTAMSTGAQVMEAQVMQAVKLLQDYQQGMEQKRVLQGVADALVILFHYYMDEQEPAFKNQMKQLVRRTLTTGVGYIKLGFQREYENRPEITSQIEDFTDRLAHIDRLMNAVDDGDVEENSAQAEELRRSIKQLQEEEEILIREGLIFEFPKSTSILVDPRCRSLKGFVGADYISVEYSMTPADVEETYGYKISEEQVSANTMKSDVDEVVDNITASLTDRSDSEEDQDEVLVWEHYHKPSGLVYVVCNACKRFLKEPSAPDVRVENFFPVRTLMFNECEHEDEIYPPSDAGLMRSQQLELNRTREALREHRLASVPQYAAGVDLDEDDAKSITGNIPHALIKLKSLLQGQKIADVLGQIPKAPIDPNHYTTNHVMEDTFLVVGSQEADLGATSGATATESSIAASSRSTAVTSNVDDLDDFFTDVARAGGQIMLAEMSKELVLKIVGPGAVWPELTRKEIMEEVYLEVEAGSSGRPNQAEDIALLERIMPFLLQIEGLDQLELAREILRRFDDKLDLTKLITPGTPSTVAINNMMQSFTGDPASDPSMQGGEGSLHAPDPGGAPPQQMGGDAPPQSAT